MLKNKLCLVRLQDPRKDYGSGTANNILNVLDNHKKTSFGESLSDKSIIQKNGATTAFFNLPIVGDPDMLVLQLFGCLMRWE